MRLRLDYGAEGLDVELPGDSDPLILKSRHGPPLGDPAGALRDALRNPIGRGPLCESVGPGDRVGIIFSDITRATPYDVILPAILAELESVEPSRITLFNATGTHRENTAEELEAILGPEVAARYRIVQNDCGDRGSHRLVGKTGSGNEAWLLGEFLDCELKIATGFIEPHFFAGFSGGGKAIMPGLALLDTVRRNHSAARVDHPEARWGVTDGNPLWEEIRDAALLAGEAFLVNVTLDRSHEITAVFAGDLVEAHRAGCEYLRSRSFVEVGELFDIVLTSNSGRPLDLNMYQSVKGMSAASQAVKEGGHIVVAAECWDGVPEHGQYRRLLASASGPDELLHRLRHAEEGIQDAWQAQIHASICKKATVHFFSENLSDEQIAMAFMKPCRDIAARLRELIAELGPAARICVLPEGPQTIPIFRADDDPKGPRGNRLPGTP